MSTISSPKTWFQRSQPRTRINDRPADRCCWCYGFCSTSWLTDCCLPLHYHRSSSSSAVLPLEINRDKQNAHGWTLVRKVWSRMWRFTEYIGASHQSVLTKSGIITDAPEHQTLGIVSYQCQELWLWKCSVRCRVLSRVSLCSDTLTAIHALLLDNSSALTLAVLLFIRLQFPSIKQASNFKITVHWKSYGVFLKVKKAWSHSSMVSPIVERLTSW